MIALWLAVAHAGIELETPPVVGQETIVVVTDDEGGSRAGETVRVVHRPSLTGEREFAVGITDGRGRVRWTPEMPGIARVRAGDEPIDVLVGRIETPVDTLLLIALIALAGLGSVAFGLGLGTRSRATGR